MDGVLYALCYLCVINLVTLIAYGADKLAAIRGARRAREDRLLLLAAVGGSVGALIGMLLFRHKIRKPKFFLGVPVILGLQLALFFAVWLLAQRYL